MALVVFLRGINVGGHRTMRPARLAEDLRAFDVVNVGAAGTFVVRRPVSRRALRAAMARRLPFGADIITCEGREIARLLEHDFFAGYPERPDVVRFVSVLSRVPRAAPTLPMQLPTAGRWMVKVLARRGRLVVGIYRREMRVLRQLAALDRSFGVTLTTRSWSTLESVARRLPRGWARTATTSER